MREQQSGTDRQHQHHSEFPNDNQITYRLWMRENRVEQTSKYQHHSEFLNNNHHLQTTNERETEWKRQAEISTILNSSMTIRPHTLYEWESNRVEQTGNISTTMCLPMTIRPLTCYKWESNRVKQTGRHQHHSEFPNNNQTTYSLWMRE